MSVTRGKRTYYPLTDSEGILMAPILLPRHDGMFIRTLFSVSGECDVRALEKAFLHLVETQDALRLRLHVGLRGVSQYVADDEPFSVPIIALRDESELEEAAWEYGTLRNAFFGNPLCRAVIFTYEGGASLFMVFSHLCFDGYSCALTAAYIKEYYLAYADGETPQSPKKRYAYTDYIAENRRYRTSGRRAEDIAYWKALFRQKPYVSRFLPAFSLRPVYSPIEAQQLYIDGARYSSVLEFCRSSGTSLSYLLTATAALTAKYLTGKRKIMFTGMSHGRSTVLQRRQIGMMVNAFPTLFDLSDEQTLKEYYALGYLSYLENVKHSNVIVYRSILSNLKVWLRQRYFPTYTDVFFGSLEFNAKNDDPRFSFRMMPSRYFFAQFYLLFFDNHTDQVVVNVSYQSGRYSAERVMQLIGTYRAILAYVISHPEQTIAQLVSALSDAQSTSDEHSVNAH